jgi:cytochrome P450
MSDAALDPTADEDVATIDNVGAASQMGLAAMFDLSAPQPNYKTLLEQGGFVQPLDKFALSFDRSISEFVLRHHELFTSRVEMNLGNIRPLIPLNVDPPNHSKYRKLLDPLFAPKRTASSTSSSIGASAISPRSSPNCSPRRCSWA